jgi:hypothetical protein
MPLTLYGQDIRMAYMDVPAQGQPNGRTVVLFHGMNFAGFYWGGPIDALRKEGFRVVVPDQIGFGRSSKPIIPYNFHDMARNTRLLLQQLKIDKAFIVGLFGRHAGSPVHPRSPSGRHLQSPSASSRPPRAAVEQRRRSLTQPSIRRSGRFTRRHLQVSFSHNPSAWGRFDKYPDSLCRTLKRRLAAR